MNALFAVEPGTPAVNFGAIGTTPPRRAGVARAAFAFGTVPGASSAIDSGAWVRIEV